jgi:hypothetical protein
VSGAPRSSAGRKTAQEVILEARLVSPENMLVAEKESLKTGRPIQQIVVEKKWADKVDVLQVLSREWRTKAVDLAEMEIDAGCGPFAGRKCHPQTFGDSVR